MDSQNGIPHIHVCRRRPLHGLGRRLRYRRTLIQISPFRLFPCREALEWDRTSHIKLQVLTITLQKLQGKYDFRAKRRGDDIREY